MKVRATKLGYYNNKRVREGATFHIKSEKDFSKHWMEKVEAGKPAPKARKPKKEVQSDSNEEVI